jgi:NhaP-type Na+/H+ or K+/H+ antiporter
VIAAYVLTNEVQEEAGLLTVTVLGMYLARRDTSTIRQVLEFNESLRTLLISALFILLAARIEPDQLTDVALPSLGFLAVLVLVGRPLTVLVATVRTSFTWQERMFLMTMAPRGIVAAAVSAIFAIRLEEEGIVGADDIVPIVFLVIIGTITVYGFLAGPAARWLRLSESHADGVLIAGAHAAGRGLATVLNDAGIKVILVDTDPYNITRAIANGVPARRLNVLAEDAANEIDLRGVGRMLAFTSNDEVNALATARFSRVFGRREVFQLAPGKGRAGQSSVPEEYLGRIIGIDGLSFTTIDERSRQGWRIRQLPGGSLAVGAVEEQRLVPIARLIDGKVVFLCHNDPVPTDGLVIGLAAPSLQHEIDALPSADTEESTRESTRESTQQSTEESAQEPTRESAEESTHDTAHSTDSPPGANRSKRGSA